MKRFLSVLLVLVMVFSICGFAAETDGESSTSETIGATNQAETVTTDEEKNAIINEVTANEKEEEEETHVKARVIEASEVGEKEYKMNYLRPRVYNASNRARYKISC